MILPIVHVPSVIAIQCSMANSATGSPAVGEGTPSNQAEFGKAVSAF
jgi:hypothetical protein